MPTIKMPTYDNYLGTVGQFLSNSLHPADNIISDLRLLTLLKWMVPGIINNNKYAKRDHVISRLRIEYFPRHSFTCHNVMNPAYKRIVRCHYSSETGNWTCLLPDDLHYLMPNMAKRYEEAILANKAIAIPFIPSMWYRVKMFYYLTRLRERTLISAAYRILSSIEIAENKALVMKFINTHEKWWRPDIYDQNKDLLAFEPIGVVDTIPGRTTVGRGATTPIIDCYELHNPNWKETAKNYHKWVSGITSDQESSYYKNHIKSVTNKRNTMYHNRRGS